jgi:GT2 family glycosyltransferase/4-hydroxybenzoate polyprenyltransferase
VNPPRVGGDGIPRAGVTVPADAGAGRTPPAVSVVVPTLDRPRRIVSAVQSLLAGNRDDFEIVVVDQSRGDATRRALAPLLSRANVRLVPAVGGGSAGARNAGLAEARAEIVAITDDDCEVRGDWVGDVLAAFGSDPGIAVVFGNVLADERDEPDRFVVAYVTEHPALARSLPDRHRVDGTAACMAVRRSVWESLGGFDSLLGVGGPLRSAAEGDFALRALRAGHFVYQTPEWSVVHHGGHDLGERPAVIDRYWYGTGAAMAKPLKWREWSLWQLPLRLAWRWAFHTSPVAAGLGDGAHRWLRLTAFGRGLLAGVRTPLDPATGHYLSPQSDEPRSSRGPLLLRWLALARWRGWMQSKLPFLTAAALLLDPGLTVPLALAVMGTIAAGAAFGYAANEVADRASDGRAGKPNRAAGLPPAAWAAFLLIAATVALGLSVLWSADAAGPILVAASLALAAAYSCPPLRLKERGRSGLVAAASAQWGLPVLAVASVEPAGWAQAATWSMCLLAMALGTRWIAVHQLRDAASDARGAVRTWASGGGDVSRVLWAALACELVLLALTLALTWPRALPAAVALGVWTGWAVLARSHLGSLPERLARYEEAPLAGYYFLLLPLALAVGLQPSLEWVVLAALLLVLGLPTVGRMLLAGRPGRGRQALARA